MRHVQYNSDSLVDLQYGLAYWASAISLAWFSVEDEWGAQSCRSVPATAFKVILSEASAYAQSKKELYICSPDPLGEATNVSVDPGCVSTAQTPTYNPNLQFHYYYQIKAILWFVMMLRMVLELMTIPAWTSLAGSELRGQRRGPPPSPVQASEPVWPINPIKLLQKNHTLTKLWPVQHRASRCPAESCFQASLPATSFLLQIIVFSITWFLVSAAEKYSHAIMVDANMMSPMKILSTSITKPFSSTWSLDWQVEWATKGTLTWLQAVDAVALVDKAFDQKTTNYYDLNLL